MSCDSAHSDHISRDGFYKSLALTAIAQQGKVVDEKSLQQYAESGMWMDVWGREGERGKEKIHIPDSGCVCVRCPHVDFLVMELCSYLFT